MFVEKPTKVFHFYTSWNKTYDLMTDINDKFIKTFPVSEKLDEIYKEPGHKIIILDDMINMLTQNYIVNCFS